MRNVIGCLSLLVMALIVGCGQTGALQLPSDPNYDKRAQYLLHKKTDSQLQPQPQNQTEQDVNKQAEHRVDQQAASEISETQ